MESGDNEIVEETEMKQYVIGVDFGTLSARAALFDTTDGTQLAESVAAYACGVMDTNLHGGPRAFVANDVYGKVLPMELYPVYLLKACLANDIEKMEKFGIYEVVEEDLALCEYVCPSKIDIQQIITDGIALMLKEMC